MHVTAISPGGSEQWLLRIDDWDFNWQGMYRYVEPLRLPAGTTIAMEFTYDNSASNVRNPNVPPRRVVAGNRSSDEMGNLALQIEPVNRDDLTLVREAQWLDMLEDDPEDSAAHFNLGVEYARRGMPAQAATHYERVIRADPDDEIAHFALAGTCVKLKNLPRAVAHYEQVLRINPRRAEAHFLLGWVLADQGQMEQAAEHLEQAIGVAPDHAMAHYRLGVVRAGQDDPTRAAKHFREALRLKPDLASARRDLDRLEKLGGTD
jgi:tetratricopeptide (TPR) repeat protein